MKRIYQVKFRLKYEGCDWEEDSMKVLANGDAMKAIEKVRTHVLKRKFNDDENGGKLIKCSEFKLDEVHILASAES